MDIIDPSFAIYKIPTELSNQSISALIDECSKYDEILQEAPVYTDKYPDYDHSYRKSRIAWLPIDHWISGMMAHLIRTANDAYFKFDITNWAGKIQYTVYDRENDYYDWHLDYLPSNLRPGQDVRKLSISLLLSDPSEYEGGELQFSDVKRNQKLKPNLGDAIIFSSLTKHRVRPIKSGIRKSLVGWYAGPLWK